jgi:hypothetical protein
MTVHQEKQCWHLAHTRHNRPAIAGFCRAKCTARRSCSQSAVDARAAANEYADLLAAAGSID